MDAMMTILFLTFIALMKYIGDPSDVALGIFGLGVYGSIALDRHFDIRSGVLVPLALVLALVAYVAFCIQHNRFINIFLIGAIAGSWLLYLGNQNR